MHAWGWWCVALCAGVALGGCAPPADVGGSDPQTFSTGSTPPIDTEFANPAFAVGAPPAKADAPPYTYHRPRRAAPIKLKQRPDGEGRARVPRPGAAACAERCGDDDGCRLLCEMGEAPQGGPQTPRFGDDCLVCGRETGFLDKPDLRIEALDASGVTLGWDAVEGADEYVVHGLRFEATAQGLEPAGSFELTTPQTRIHVALSPGFAYGFYVIAWDRDAKRRSPPSVPVHVDP